MRRSDSSFFIEDSRSGNPTLSATSVSRSRNTATTGRVSHADGSVLQNKSELASNVMIIYGP